MGRQYSSARPGTQPQPNPLAGVTFTLDGVTFSCAGGLRMLDVSELAETAAAGLDSRDPAAVAAITQFLRLALGDAEYRRFRAHTREHGTPDEVILDIIAGLNEELGAGVEAATGRPTVPQPGSSPGLPDPDERVSKVVSLGTGDVRVMPAGPKAKRKAAGSRA